MKNKKNYLKIIFENKKLHLNLKQKNQRNIEKRTLNKVIITSMESIIKKRRRRD